MRETLPRDAFTLHVRLDGVYKTCPACGKEVKIDLTAPVCPECGANMEKEEA